jgi:SAM-dependent methyltransferase
MLDRERFGSGRLPIWVRNEHLARWRFAAGLVPAKVVVDCACGTGAGSAIFAEAGASQVYAYDLSERAVEQARQRCAPFPHVVVQQASGLSLPLAGASIDMFVSLETIEHIDDDAAFLREIVRVLTPVGTLICSTPNRSITMPGKVLTDRPWNPFHVREYNQQEFATLLRERFRTVRLLGQNARSAWRVGLLEEFGRRLPGHVGGRVNSVLKLPRLAYDRESHHRVRELPGRGTCEYLVAVCSDPVR